MLVLTRRDSESVQIGDDVSIRVLSVNNGIVKFGIDAPREISVHREEIYQKTLRQLESEIVANNK